MNQDQIEKHSTTQSVILHLLPGILVGCFYLLARQPVADMGYPSIIALILAYAFILIPVELGYLLYQGKKKIGHFTLQGIICYRNSIPWWQYLVWVFVIFIAVGVIFTLLKPVDAFLREWLFFCMPDINNGLDGNYSRKTLIVTYSMVFILVAVLTPLVEELYFRGYLLPRMKGKYAPLFHSFLFAAQHVLEPWMIITRTFGFLPILFGVKKKNIHIGIIVHILCNMVNVVTGIAFIVKMT
ncbi:MAG: CPBP family intramembrane metalloprotease [Chloroflexi bacterium]|nr:CPBP family intramembrane metalloprotease [Chloroflexota bacterium]